MHFFSGLIGVIVGVLVVRYSAALTENLGTIEFAERYLHGGMAGTYTFYRITGVVVIILSLMYMFGVINILLGPVAGLFGNHSQQ